MPAGSVSEEISHLMRDKGWKQDRAVAASLNMQRAGKFGKRKGKRRKKRGRSR